MAQASATMDVPVAFRGLNLRKTVVMMIVYMVLVIAVTGGFFIARESTRGRSDGSCRRCRAVATGRAEPG